MWVKDWYGRLHNMNYIKSVYFSEGEIFPLVVRFVDNTRNECDVLYIRELPVLPPDLGKEIDTLLMNFLDEFLLYLGGSSQLFKGIYDVVLMWERFVGDVLDKWGEAKEESEKLKYKENLMASVRG